MTTTRAHTCPSGPERLPDDRRAELARRGLDPDDVIAVISRCLDEDLAAGGDVTTEAIFDRASGRAAVVSRQAGCLAGVPVAVAALWVLAARTGTEVEARIVRDDGQGVLPGDVVVECGGPLRTLLTAERTMLNLVSQLSGVATATAAWVEALAGSGVRVRDTRKTVPGLRALQKYAVRCGGGVNHRMGLGDAALVKDNHVAAAGSVAAALAAVRAHAPQVPCEVECDTVEQVRQAVDAGAELVLLDNMGDADMRRATELCHAHDVRTEASGGLTLDRARAVAATGVDFIAVGALTHSAPVLDLGLDMVPGSPDLHDGADLHEPGNPDDPGEPRGD